MKRSELEPTLTAALRAGRSAPCAAPVDPVALAEYLDGVLPEQDRAALEQHLAGCRECRELATEAGLAIAAAIAADVPAAPATARQGAYPSARASRVWAVRGWLAAAAVLLAAAGVFAWLRTSPERERTERRATLGVPEEAWRELDGAARATVERALTGTLEPPPVFAELLAGNGSVLRSAEGAEAPLPLSPRWSVVRDPRPTLRFAVPPPALAAGPQGCEVLVVDRREEPVLAAECHVADPAAQLFAHPWPADQPALEPGAVYAWKVNLELDGEWVASEYVPFQVLPAGVNVPRHHEDLAAGAELLEAGLNEEALERWSRLSFGEDGADLRRRLLRSVLEQQRLPEPWIERELARRTGVGTP